MVWEQDIVFTVKTDQILQRGLSFSISRTIELDGLDVNKVVTLTVIN
jgi:hypothetical protein